MSYELRSLLRRTTIILGLFFAPTNAFAQAESERTATAIALYDQAVVAMDAKDYEQACPKLEEATRLEPSALGAKLKLAECYEGQGKLASAWSTYSIVARAAAEAKNTERQKKAQTRADALLPRLSQLKIVVNDPVKALPGLTISRDGMPIGSSQWNELLPIDLGKHVITVDAVGKERLVGPIEITAEGATMVIEVPMPRDAPAITPITPPVPAWMPMREPLVRMEADASGVLLYRVPAAIGAQRTAAPTAQVGGTNSVVLDEPLLPEPLCVLPCTPPFAAIMGQELYFGGDGVTASDHFTIGVWAQDRTFRVSKGRKAFQIGGSIALSLAAVALGLGTGLYLHNDNHFSGASVTSLLVGGVGIAVGLPLLSKGKTSYMLAAPIPPLAR